MAKALESGIAFDSKNTVVNDGPELHDKTRINMLWACFVIMAIYISAQLIAGILTGTTSVMADSAQGMIDVATYGVSIYSQYKIDKSGDTLYQRKTGIWSAYFGAGTLLAMGAFFLTYTIYTILNTAEESPEAWLMVGASIMNATIDVICMGLMNRANPMSEIIPWLFGKGSGASPHTHPEQQEQGSWGGGATYGAIKEGETDQQKKDSDYELSSALNVGSSLVHVLADLGRSFVIFAAGVAIIAGADDGSMDQIASIVVNVIGIALAVKVIVLTRSLARELEDEERLAAGGAGPTDLLVT